MKTITTDAAPTALEYVQDKDKDILVTALADMTLATYSLTDPNVLKRYQHQSSWVISLYFRSITSCDMLGLGNSWCTDCISISA